MKNLKIILISFVIAVIFIEIFIRLVHEDKIKTSRREICHQGDAGKGYFEDDHCYYIFDTTSKLIFNLKTGYVPEPNAKGQGYKINNFFARDNLSFEKINDLKKKKIVLTGGSVAFGAGNNQNNTISNFFNKINKKYYIINLGVGGYTLNSEYNLYKDKLYMYDHEIWISLSGLNDRYSSYVSEDYYDNPDMTNIKKKLENYDIYSNENIKPNIYKNYQLKIIYYLDKFFYKDDIKKISYPPPYRKFFKRMEYDNFKKKFEADLKIAILIAKLNDICFVYALQPDLFSTQKKLSQYENTIKNNYNAHEMADHYIKIYNLQKKILENFHNTENLNYIIIDDAIKNTKNDLFLDEGHFGSKGNSLIANFINEKIAKQSNDCM